MDQRNIIVCLKDQTLCLQQGDQLIKQWKISTALNGAGNALGSGCTPLGHHYIKAKIGENAVLGAVFVGRRLTGEVYSNELLAQFPARDWILTRILWLQGKESGINRGGNVDSMRRFIYIHGTPDTEPMGVPLSHGCVRMRNADVVELFDQVEVGTPVNIVSQH